jgi:hypothetical protein
MMRSIAREIPARAIRLKVCTDVGVDCIEEGGGDIAMTPEFALWTATMWWGCEGRQDINTEAVERRTAVSGERGVDERLLFAGIRVRHMINSS